jgi:hypothetical protein
VLSWLVVEAIEAKRERCRRTALLLPLPRNYRAIFKAKHVLAQYGPPLQALRKGVAVSRPRQRLPAHAACAAITPAAVDFSAAPTSGSQLHRFAQRW